MCVSTTTARRTIPLQLPRVYEDLFRPARYKVYEGGRGAAKDWSFSRVLLVKAAERQLRVLCLRELQTSIKDSVHRLLSDQIEALGLGDFYRVTESEIRGANGSLFLFRGVRHNVTEIKSIEGVDIAWVNEAQAVTADSWEIIDPTIRKEGSEIWVSFNPDSPDDETYQRFVVTQRPSAIVRHVTYRDNPWFSDVLRVQMEWDRTHRPDLYEWKWEGHPRKITDALVFHGHYRLEPIDVDTAEDTYIGADWGFSQDPSAFVRAFVERNTLYVPRAVGGVGIEMDDLPAVLDRVLPTDEAGKPRRKWPTRADSARPETISYLNKRGYNLLPAKKGKGSIEDGVEYLKSFDQIVIDPDHAKPLADEMGLYSYKTERVTNDVLPVIVDAHNHYIDALRYALEGRRHAAPRFDRAKRQAPRTAGLKVGNW